MNRGEIVGKGRKRNHREEDDNDNDRLKRLAKLMRGVKPAQKNKFHERKPKARNLKDLANDYNRDGELEEVD